MISEWFQDSFARYPSLRTQLEVASALAEWERREREAKRKCLHQVEPAEGLWNSPYAVAPLPESFTADLSKVTAPLECDAADSWETWSYARSLAGVR
jgi:hypothetical protein